MDNWFLERIRRDPVVAFGAAGGGFALLFILSNSIQTFLAGQGFPMPDRLLWLFVVGGTLGGALLAWLLWGRLGGGRSRRRGAGVGALIGLLSLPVPFYILEIALIVVQGNPFEPLPGASPIVQALSDLALFLLTPIFLGVLGLIPTYGGTIVLGALVGILLATD